MADFADLEQLVGAVQFSGPDVQWAELESAAGLRFPDDYKRIFQKYPDLEFDRFLRVSHPGGDVQGFLAGVNCALDSLRYLAAESDRILLVDDFGNEKLVPRMPIFPDAGGLFHWGGTQNGDYCLWLTSDPDPNRWPILITDDTKYWRYEGGIVDFLVGVMRRDIRCPAFPSGFPSSLRVDQFQVLH
ncbi:SMI1/KNR4 family protein [Actinomadura spongiicola]|uniref:hypothetical protein n=1 Tax=Actinomadura spongiicola TaxID=2303421 RepID=UPI0011C14BBE|nr:hypothetical protein [Actinomadura spongiicola]